MRRAPLVTLLALALAGPAAADPLPPPTPVVLTVTVHWVGRAFGAVDGACAAVVAGAVAATVIDECRVYYTDYDPLNGSHPAAGPNGTAAAPGNAAASLTGAQLGIFGSAPRVCVGAYTIPLHAPAVPVRAEVCAGAGPIGYVWQPSGSGTATTYG